MVDCSCALSGGLNGRNVTEPFLHFVFIWPPDSRASSTGASMIDLTLQIHIMADSPRTVRTLFHRGNQLRQRLETSNDAKSSAYEEILRDAISTFEDCRRLAHEVSLFSSNETLEDVTTDNLQ